MKKLISSLSIFLSVATQANITPKAADYSLLTSPPNRYVQTQIVAYKVVEQYTKAMFSDNEKLRVGLGYQNYKVVQNLANTGNPYAQYNAGLYQILNQDYFNFELIEALILLKKAADAGVLDAKYSIALIYQGRSQEISKLLNKDKENNEQRIRGDAKRLTEISTQYILDGAMKGHEKSYLMACNYYVRGHYLDKNAAKAALCYNHAISKFRSTVAYGLLAQIYFEDPAFSTLEYEKEGRNLAKIGSLKGDTFAMAILGLRLIYPKFGEYADVDTGTELIKAAFQHDDPVAKTYSTQYFDGAWRLLKPPSKKTMKFAYIDNSETN